MSAEREQRRRAFLRGLGLADDAVETLLAYNRNEFRVPEALRGATLPLADEPFVDDWRRFLDEAARTGTVQMLQRVLRQLCFPVREGMSQDETYRRAVFRGAPPPSIEVGAYLRDPEGITVELMATPAGHLPLISVGDRADFVHVIRALAHRNEPAAVPDSMGALLVGGYNNHARIEHQRDLYIEAHGPLDWPQAYKRLLKDKALYQDRLVVASRGFYSAVLPGELGLDETTWLALSQVIRARHEGTHYFTRRYFGSMRDNLFDELLADYAGIVAATGRFRAGWWLRFMGLEAFPAYRSGGRLQNYLGDPPLAGEAFEGLCRLVRDAACAIEACEDALRADGRLDEGGSLLTSLAWLSLDEIAAPGVLEAAVRDDRLV